MFCHISTIYIFTYYFFLVKEIYLLTLDRNVLSWKLDFVLMILSWKLGRVCLHAESGREKRRVQLWGGAVGADSRKEASG